ncbi:MAG: PadR family transcriptional regulator [Dehalococcoidia bacterium]
MRRKPGTLLPIEVSILRAGLDLREGGEGEFHGYLIASRIREHEEARLLTAHGTLYKALDRMQKAGLLVSRWEDPMAAAAEERPRRRLYHVSAVGERALHIAEADAARDAATLKRGLQPS